MSILNKGITIRATFTVTGKKVIEITKCPVELWKQIGEVIEYSEKVKSLEHLALAIQKNLNDKSSDSDPQYEFKIRKITPNGKVQRCELVRIEIKNSKL